ncbi:LysR family transcriptional regulator [Sphingopyxis sp.]|uniref:LysR family transcriptional regulator n=1 Tax=Sphingopyxis sp. TaxID=1908224 RepID=UPI002D7947AB|nr:LysR family transcriptional regulator [Sphingopyxis sp.]HET6522891.1 LysR family transcriptional regulator [Sphingopyxis sp.]
MDFKQLLYFVRVVEEKSVTKAAEQLRIAQPAVGWQIRNLEADLRVQLLVRHSRGVEPTEAGAVLLEHSRKLLQGLQDARLAVQDLSEVPRGRVSLGVTPATAALSSRLVHRSLSEMPHIKLNVVQALSHDLVEMVLEDKLDLACVFNASSDRGLVVTPLLVEDLHLVGPAGSFSPTDGPIEFRDLENLPLIIPPSPHGMRLALEEAAAEAETTIDPLVEVESQSLVVELVKSGTGVTILPLGAVKEELDQGMLSARAITGPSLRTVLSIIYKQRRPLSRAADAILALTMATFRGKPTDGADHPENEDNSAGE